MKSVTDIHSKKQSPVRRKKIKVSPEKDEKSILMEELIKKKDLSLLAENKDKLKPAEFKFVEGKIKNK
jgi:hypothetical protein